MKKLYQRLATALIFFSIGSIGLNAQTAQQRVEIKKLTNVSELKSLGLELSDFNLKEKRKAERIALQRGWEVQGRTLDGAYFELMKVTADGTPIYYQTYNKNAAISTRANTLNSGGLLNLDLNGEGMLVHVWDGGHALTTHQEYDGPGGQNRVSIGDSGYSTNYHSGHVMGTILSFGYQANAKGMAPKAYGVSYDWTNDSSEASSAAANSMILSNHSYGYRSDMVPDQYFGAYIDESRTWDQIMYNAPYYLMVVAAGNDGGNDNYNAQPLGGNSAFDKLTGHSVSKNNLVVANVQDAQIDSQGNLVSVTRNYSSSEGPTDDYRIKPDIAGNGTSVYSSSVESSSSYQTLTGTSMASPNVTGTLLLLQQHHTNLYGNIMKAATLKGLALHTADDISPVGPDAETGWGLMNAKAAAEALSQKGSKSLIEELTLSNNQTYTTTVNVANPQDLKVSISWTDPAGNVVTATNSSTPVLVNDLNLVVTKNSTSYYPWKLTGVTTNGKGVNNVDPFERVDISNASGEYTIKVTHSGSLSGGAQNFSLIVTGISGQASEDTVAPTAPLNLAASNATATSLNLNWGASTDNVGVTGYEIYMDNVLYGTVSGTSEEITGLTPNTTYAFKVRAYDAAGNKSNFSKSVSATTLDGPAVAYCTSSSNNSNDEYISKVVFGSINNSSANTRYSDYTNLSTDVTKGETYTLNLTKAWTGTVYNEAVRAWIDFNGDGDFDDAGELILNEPADKVANKSVNVAIPANAATGSTRMRIIISYNSGAAACGTYNYGETEDYTVNIVDSVSDTQAPSTPTSLAVSGKTTSSISLNWSASTDNVGVVGYNVYQDGVFAKSVTGTSTTMTNLSEGTSYSFRVSAIDAADNESVKSNSVSATTDVNTPAPVDYCSLQGNNSSYEWIDYVALGNMSNVTGNDGGYADYTNKVANIGYGTNTVYLSAGFSSSIYTEYWYVWVDLNQDGVFSSSELLVSGSARSSQTLNGTLNIPSTAKQGKTRMRVAMKYNQSSSACGSFGYGEVEDYTVNISSTGGNSTYASIESTALNSVDEAAKRLNVYPNPVKSGFVNIKSNELKDGSYELIDVNGSLIKFGIFTGESIKINVDGLPTGKYFVRISKDGRQATEGIIIQ